MWTEFHYYCKQCNKKCMTQGFKPIEELCGECEEIKAIEESKKQFSLFEDKPYHA